MELREKQKEIAVALMKIFKSQPKQIKGFKEGIIYYTAWYSHGLCANDNTLFPVSIRKRFVKEIKKLEERTGCLVYKAKFESTGFCDYLSLLYVSNNTKNWKKQIKLAKEKGEARCYVVPLSFLWNDND